MKLHPDPNSEIVFTRDFHGQMTEVSMLPGLSADKDGACQAGQRVLHYSFSCFSDTFFLTHGTSLIESILIYLDICHNIENLLPCIFSPDSLLKRMHAFKLNVKCKIQCTGV